MSAMKKKCTVGISTWFWENISMTTYCGCVLYTVPSTPTVILNVLKLRFRLIRLKMAASPAATRFEDLKDTMVLICWTATQSSGDGFKSSSVRMSLVLLRPVLYLKTKKTSIGSLVVTQSECDTDRQMDGQTDNSLLHGCNMRSGNLPCCPQGVRHLTIKQLSTFSHL